MRFIGWILAELPRAVVGNDRIEEVLREPGHGGAAAAPGRAAGRPLGCDVQDLAARTTRHAGPRRRDLEVAPRSRWRSSGTTGVGKSTLTQLLVRLDDPDEGEVLIGGVDLREVDPVALRASVPWCSRRASCSPTAVERTSPWTPAPMTTIVRAAKIAAGDRFIRALPKGYDTIVGERGLSLSGGRATAGGAGAGVGAQATGADPGRRDQRGGPLDRGRDPGRHCAANSRRRSSWSPTACPRSGWPTG